MVEALMVVALTAESWNDHQRDRAAPQLVNQLGKVTP
jgi:hypothetical protein